MYHTTTFYSLLILAACLSMAVLFNYNTPPDGYTGAPDELSCNSCHEPPLEDFTTVLLVQDLPDEVIAGQTYPITIRLNSNYGVQAGFEAVALREDARNGGFWSNPGPAVTTSMSNNRRYAKHNIAPQMEGPPRGRYYEFMMDWEPVSVEEIEEITIWAAGVAGAETEGQYDDAMAEASFTTTVYLVLAATIEGPTRVSCFGENDAFLSVEASGGKTPYTYEWSTGASSSSINNLGAGTYFVTVTDELGQEEVLNQTINEPPQLEGGIDLDQSVSCAGSSDGALSAIISGGTSPYTYQWSNGQSGRSLTNLESGNYTVTVLDDNDCLLLLEYFLDEPSPLAYEVVEVVPEDCGGSNNGAIVIEALGGTPAYQYQWSNGQSGAELEGLPSGTYQLTITDRAGCDLVTDLIIPQLSDMSLSSISQQNVSCAGENDGSIAIEMEGGVLPYSFEWSNGSTAAFITELTAGAYELTITDGEGCVLIEQFTLTEPDILDVETDVIENIDCAGDQSGAISVSALGGTGPYFFLWNNGATSSSINNLAAGNYLLTITDNEGCELVQDFVLSEPDSLFIDLALQVDPLCASDQTGEITVIPTGGTPPYSYTWNNGATTNELSGLAAGLYGLTVTDNLGCIQTATYELTAPTELTLVDIALMDATEGQGGSIALQVEGGTPPYNFIWEGDNGFMAEGNPINNLEAGNYEVIVTDANGCVLSDAAISFTVDFTTSTNEVQDDLQLSIFPNPARQFLHIDTHGQVGWLTISAINGQQMWRKQATGNDRMNVDLGQWPAGTYFIRWKMEGGSYQYPFVIQP